MKKSRTGRWLIALAVIAALLIAGWILRQEPGTEVGVTPDLLGDWVTDTPGHQDRYLEIRSGEIAFGLGDEGEARHLVLGVRRVEGPEGLSTYVVRYSIDDEEPAEGRLELLVGPGGLVIRNQPGIRWSRRP